MNDCQRLHYNTYGETSNPPLIVLHGLLGESSNWRTAARFLQQDYYVIALDLRNHGKSPHYKGMSYLEMSNDVLAIMQHLQLETVSIMGHSMGGKVAMYLALHNAKRIQQLIVVDIAPVTYPLLHQSIFKTLLTLPISEIKNRQEADRHLSIDIDDPFERSFLLKNLARTDDGFQWQCNLTEISRNYLKIADFPKTTERYDKRCLFVQGGRSNYINTDNIPLIHPYFPQAEIQKIPKAGHLPHVQTPQSFLQTVIDYITD
ncbi:MAG: Alpha/beta hydrolase [uncultured Thiotrichaceae bacterium]|uniref:Alpha/beta hydrolase n=1 Tax=uncultured Thiotrichaceae bacterium TaxID=298394 RepID=A0A6S6SEF2_9GAMM|nr:MAG: Alpha/beta hydrolase [uncultured Thiotrichaceae bacterium]